MNGEVKSGRYKLSTNTNKLPKEKENKNYEQRAT